ncbi:hypothetical protein [Wenjunlia tyrosinilytica]|jgi:hypothetical protein|uniref:Uncharacterized protein n=1 Tax=Wenjunlia tyrosinilytica TaxID=1544741 RepID=A0A917ZYZ0_9ACTN|nr:hypothetical protein [Wenjunlia tyrosinilytica]GGO98042.1 hypothetical protein GCM10012280_61250 [Wenjunlia tyrosinilytica]
MARDADLDRGSPPVANAKRAVMMESQDKTDRDEQRAGLRELDDMVEQSPGLTRLQRDAERAMPRDATSDSVRERRFPADNAERKLSVRRQRDLNKQKTGMDRAKIPRTAKQGFQKVFGGDGGRLTQLNDALSDSTGDVQSLPPDQQRDVQRVDRVILEGERLNTAENVVYTNVQLPPGVNSGNVQQWVNRRFGDGTEVNFDRYTVSTHDMGQLPPGQAGAPALEIKTRRGIYVGNAPKGNSTHSNATHVLPRGMRLRVAGSRTVPYRAQDGSTQQRTVLQLEDY